jgi:hypothetical protein
MLKLAYLLHLCKISTFASFYQSYLDNQTNLFYNELTSDKGKPFKRMGRKTIGPSSSYKRW